MKIDDNLAEISSNLGAWGYLLGTPILKPSDLAANLVRQKYPDPRLASSYSMEVYK